MKIEQTPVTNGTRFAAVCDEGLHRFTVDVTNDDRFFTIRDAYGQPLGTITRPRVLGALQTWQAHTHRGTMITERAEGARSAFRAWLVWHDQI